MAKTKKIDYQKATKARKAKARYVTGDPAKPRGLRYHAKIAEARARIEKNPSFKLQKI
jgi:hypothetical protein